MTLNEILVTKMCHDLAGSIGTLSNTTELLDVDPSFVKEGTALLKQSTAVLVSRLKFFRALLGLETDIYPELARGYLQTLPMPVIVTGKVCSRLHLVFVLLASEILIRGGSVEIGDEGIICNGKAFQLDQEKRAVLTGEKLDFKPQYASILWLRVWMKEHHLKVDIFQNEETLTIQLIPDC